MNNEGDRTGDRIHPPNRHGDIMNYCLRFGGTSRSDAETKRRDIWDKYIHERNSATSENESDEIMLKYWKKCGNE